MNKPLALPPTRSSRYPAKVFWSIDDEAFVALAEDLPGCAAAGDSQTEALAELQVAIDNWIEASEGAGNAIPRPSFMPTIVWSNSRSAAALPVQVRIAVALDAAKILQAVVDYAEQNEQANRLRELVSQMVELLGIDAAETEKRPG